MSDQEFRIQEDRERMNNYREELENMKKPEVNYPDDDDDDEMLDEIRNLQKLYLRTLKENGFYYFFNDLFNEKGEC